MRRLFFCAVLIGLSGCGAQQGNLEWAKSRESGMSLSEATARCDYETTAATQGTDYSFRSSLGQELDRAIRKRDLEQKCMAANGFVLVPRRSEEQKASASYYRQLDDQLAEAKKARAQAYDAFRAAPDPAAAAALKPAVISGNARVSNLEEQLGYVKSKPMEID